MKEKQPRIHYMSATQHVDMDTGEVITSDQVKNKKYLIIKKQRHVTHATETLKLIEWTNLCRRIETAINPKTLQLPIGI